MVSIIIQDKATFSSNTPVNLEILNYLQEGVILVNSTKQILFWNNAAENITGFSSEETLGKPYNKEILKHYIYEEEELEGDDCPVFQVLSTDEIFEDKVLIADKFEMLIPAMVSIIPVKDQANNIIGAIEIINPLTSTENLEKAYFKLKAKLNESRTFINKIMLTSEKLDKKLEESMYLDPLTKFYNRLYLNIDGQKIIKGFQNTTQCISLLLIEVDNFKKTNNRYGYQAGDELLKRVSRIIKTSSSENDLLFRFSGCKFLIISPGASTKEATGQAEKIRRNIEANKFRFQTIEMVSTVSTGIAHKEAHLTTPLHKLIIMAEEALSIAQKEGRNKTSIFKT